MAIPDVPKPVPVRPPKRERKPPVRDPQRKRPDVEEPPDREKRRRQIDDPPAPGEPSEIIA